MPVELGEQEQTDAEEGRAQRRRQPGADAVGETADVGRRESGAMIGIGVMARAARSSL